MVKIIDNYTLTDYLGKGEYGKVYKAFNIDTKIDVAIKMVPLNKFQEVNKLVELTRNEIETIRLLEENIHIVKFVEMIKSNHFIYLIYEYCEEGTLEELIRKRGKLPEKEAIMIFKQLISAFRSLHQFCVLHRDVKPNNIFFKSNHLKLADFGFCKRLRTHDDLTQTSLGSPLYMAPEILNGDVYGNKIDIWSCGVVLYEMLFGQCPYSEHNIKELMDVYNSSKYNLVLDGSISPTTEGMLRRMLQKDQFKRISWEDFFYEYEFSSQGVVHRKEKDFQYDLMKLMKKNTHQPHKKQSLPFKFDWSKITDKNSSVHSEELNNTEEAISEQNLNEILFVKKKIKEFENSHTKMVEMSLVIEAMLESAKTYYYSQSLLYFVIHNLSSFLSSMVQEIQSFLNQHKSNFGQDASEINALNKLLVVFSNQHKSVTLKANSIKVTLMTHDQIEKDLFKYPNRVVMRKYLLAYLHNFQQNSVSVCDLSQDGDRQDAHFLLRLLWAVALDKGQGKSENDKARKLQELLSVKAETSKLQICIMLNKYLVHFQI